MNNCSNRKQIISDEQIIEMYWARNEKAIKETDEKYGSLLFRIAYNILHDRCDCEECQNDTYLGVWNTIPPTRPSVFPAFITRILRRIAINRYHYKTSQKRVPSEFTVSMEELNETLQSDMSVERDFEAKELGEMISDYVKYLSERQQYIFVGRYYMAEAVDRLAADLGISVSSVYRELEKIKAGLKSYLERRGVYV